MVSDVIEVRDLSTPPFKDCILKLTKNKFVLVCGGGGSGKSVLLGQVLIEPTRRVQWLIELLASEGGVAAAAPKAPGNFVIDGCDFAVSLDEQLARAGGDSVAKFLGLSVPLELCGLFARVNQCPECSGSLAEVNSRRAISEFLRRRLGEVLYLGYSCQVPSGDLQRREFVNKLARRGLARFLKRLSTQCYEEVEESILVGGDNVVVVFDRLKARQGNEERVLDGVNVLQECAAGEIVLVSLEEGEILTFTGDSFLLCGECGRLVSSGGEDALRSGPDFGGCSMDDALRFIIASQQGGRSVEFVQDRLRRSCQLGLGHIGLGDNMSTLTSHERTRLALVAMVQPGLTDVVYLLDAPSIGASPAEIGRVAEYLKELVAAHATVVFATAVDEVVSLLAPYIDEVVNLEVVTASSLGAALPPADFGPCRTEEGESVPRMDFVMSVGRSFGDVAVHHYGGLSIIEGPAEQLPDKAFQYGRELSSGSAIMLDPQLIERAELLEGNRLGEKRVRESLGIAKPLAELYARLNAAKVRGLSVASLLPVVHSLMRGEVNSASKAKNATVAQAIKHGTLAHELLWRGESLVSALNGTLGQFFSAIGPVPWRKGLLTDLMILGLERTSLALPISRLSHSERVRLALANRLQGPVLAPTIVDFSVLEHFSRRDRGRILKFLAYKALKNSQAIIVTALPGYLTEALGEGDASNCT